MLAFLAQFGAGAHPGHANLLAPLALIVIAGLAGGLLLGVLGQLVPRVRRVLRSRAAERRRLHAAATAELRAKALMDELCPHGWRAQITLFGSESDLPSDSPTGQGHRVALDWMQLGEAASQPTVRRVWATTVTGALDAMVADRGTDETLQQIEQGALSDGAVWPD